MRTLPCFLLAFTVAGCDRASDAAPVTVFAAASLARPLAEIATAYEERARGDVRTELGGSLEHARKITDLARVPDALALADDEVLASLMPAHLDWYVRFATTRLVIAYRPGSTGADEITADNWWRILTRPGVRIGRADSALAPAGRHALALIRRAEPYYRQPRLADRLFVNARPAFVRPNASELATLLETGEVDYILEYESVARQMGFETIALPRDLSIPVLYGVSIPRGASNRDGALALVTLLLGDTGMRALREAHMDALRVPVAVGSGIPAEITDLVRTLTADPSAR